MKRVLVSLTAAVALAAALSPAVSSSAGTPNQVQAPAAPAHDGPCPFASSADV